MCLLKWRNEVYHLYKKTHNITGLKYLGQTTKNPYKYRGSGTYWKRHIKIHTLETKQKMKNSWKKRKEILCA